MPFLGRMALCFLAGGVGGLVNSLAVWSFGMLGISQALGANIAPPLTLGWLLPRLFFGGLWGFIFFVPVLNARPVLKCAMLSLAPTAYMLFKVFPQLGKGTMGLTLGPGTPFMVVFFNVVWGVAAALVLVRAGRPDLGAKAY